MQVENRPSAEPRQELVAAVPGATAPVAITPLTPLDSGSPRRRFGIPGWIPLLLSNRYALFGTIMLLIIVLAAIFAPLITPYDPNNIGEGLPSLAPSADHWFGTNHSGEDIFAQVIYGGRLSLLIGATVLGGRPSLREEQQRTLDSLKVRETARRQNERSLRGLK